MGISSFDEMFDFNRDGSLDTFEQAMQIQFLDEMSNDEESDSLSFEERELIDHGLDLDELDLMDEDERREALEDAGLDPDEYDF